MRRPFCLPRMTWTAASSPRLTRCNTVWRETPSARIAPRIGRKSLPASPLKRSLRSLVRRIRQGAPGVGCSPAIMPSLSKRWIVDGATPSTTAAFLIVSSSPSGPQGVGSKREYPSGGAGCRRGRREAMTICRGPLLPIENAGDHTIGVMGGEPAQQRDRVLVGADGGRPRARQSEVDLVERAALPAQREVGGRLVAIDLDRDVFDEGA